MSTTDETRDAQSGVAEVLAAHWAAVGPVSGAWLCTCGTRSTNGHVLNDNLTSKEERQAEYRAHVAAALAPLLAAERAKALREAADELKPRSRGEACDNAEDCCGSAASCDAVRPLKRMATEAWLRDRADREQP